MRKLSHVFPDGADLLRHYWAEGAREEIFLPAQTSATPGELLDLEVELESTGYRLHTLAQVLQRSPQRTGRPAGSLVRLVGAPGRRPLLEHAGAPQSPGPRQQIPCGIPITVVRKGESTLARAVAYSIGGVQVLGGPATLDVGDTVQLLLLRMPALLSPSLTGEVVWLQRLPELAAGISLRSTANRVQRPLERLHERLLAYRCRQHGGPA